MREIFLETWYNRLFEERFSGCQHFVIEILGYSKYL